jgi:CelD/BcsL family acetyltransferase involved in cellulose biosynthesis
MARSQPSAGARAIDGGGGGMTAAMRWAVLPAARFAEVAPHWETLRVQGPHAPMLAPDFITTLLDAFGTGREYVALCLHGGVPLAAAVVAPQGRASWATFQPAQAPVGLWLQQPGADVSVLLAGLARALPGAALVVGLTQCDPFLLPRPADGPFEACSDYIETARITIAGDFDTWWNGRGKNLRTNLKKQRNKLVDAGVVTRMEVLRAPHEMAQAVADYGRLESAGWKGRAGTAVAADNDQGRFYRRMLEAFCARGAGCVYRYYFNDGGGERLVATDLCIEDGDCIVILKTAYDETVPKQYSPALLMREEACRQLFDGGRIRRIEFYGKVMEWHTRWTEEIRTLYHLNHYRWPAVLRLHRFMSGSRRKTAGPPPAR